MERYRYTHVIMSAPSHQRTVRMNDTVIVRSVRPDEWLDRLADMRVYFGGHTRAPSAKPSREADYVAFYQGAPRSAITHLGIVRHIERNADMLGSDVFHLSCLIALDPPIVCGRAVSNFLYTTLRELGIDRISLSMKRRRSVVFRR